MANTSARSPGTAVNDTSFGALAWDDPNNIKVSDDVSATVDGDVVDERARIVNADGTIGTTDKSIADDWSSSYAYVSYGSSTDLWGETWTAADINDANFGFALAIFDRAFDIPQDSNYLKGTNFGFSISEGSTINGILVEVKRKVAGPNFFTKVAYVDHMRITVYYTEASSYNPAFAHRRLLL